MAARLLTILILGYRATLGRLVGGHCRFEPSCSQYALDAIRKHGPLKGTARALTRICRCHPFSPGGYDPA